MGSAESSPLAAHEAVTKPWDLKSEAERIFKLADEDGDGFLSLSELTATLRRPEHAAIVMNNLDVTGDGRVSLNEWLVCTVPAILSCQITLPCCTCEHFPNSTWQVAQKQTFDKSAAALRTALKGAEKSMAVSREGAASGDVPEPDTETHTRTTSYAHLTSSESPDVKRKLTWSPAMTGAKPLSSFARLFRPPAGRSKKQRERLSAGMKHVN